MIAMDGMFDLFHFIFVKSIDDKSGTRGQRCNLRLLQRAGRLCSITGELVSWE